jgi:hypothetical protein
VLSAGRGCDLRHLFRGIVQWGRRPRAACPRSSRAAVLAPSFEQTHLGQRTCGKGAREVRPLPEGPSAPNRRRVASFAKPAASTLAKDGWIYPRAA